MDNIFKILQFNTISKLLVNPDYTAIKFITTKKEEFVFVTDGDCCNEVWIAHMNGVENLLDGVVMFVEEKGWEDVNPTRQEVEEAAFWTIISSNGYFDLEVRNSHNGYYGGMFVRAHKDYQFDDSEAIEIIEDF